jgi:isopentenyl-diphosphate delta-isomerase
MMVDYVVLVNNKDQEIGTMEKMEAHLKGLLHRAFSVFIFNSKGEMLIHRRALGKYHSPGLWTNTCCSHPRPNEAVLDAANRRMDEEMGMSESLTKTVSFVYHHKFDNGLIEHEFDHILIGNSDALPSINEDEVDSFKYIGIEELEQSIKQNPDDYTVWFKLAYPKLKAHLS